MSFLIVFNLYPFNETLYLPSANVVQIDKSGQPSHIMQRATPQTCPAYGLEVNSVVEKAFALIEQLTPKALEQKFKPPKAKTAPTLAQLLAEKGDVQRNVEAYIHRHLDLFLSHVVQHGYPITLDAEKKTLAKDVLLDWRGDQLQACLSFKKTPGSGVEYRLELADGARRMRISEHDVFPLTNTEPSWLVINHNLYRISSINGNMVRPFRQKDVVLIPPDKERVYFRQFIAKSIRRSEIEAEGFSVKRSDTLLFTRLEAVENILENRWFLRPVFEYDGASFPYGDRRDKVTSLDIPEKDDVEITVRLVVRHPQSEEKACLELSNAGLADEGRSFSLPETASLSSLVDFLATHRQELEQAGFRVEAPQTDGKILALDSGQISVRSVSEGDWFDVSGIVRVGDVEFPFRSLLPNLRRRDPFFPLKNGTWFLIPDSWFTRYADLADALQESGDQLRLPKALYTVLEGVELDASAPMDWPVIDPEAIDYTPPQDLRATLRPYQLTGVKWLIGHHQHGFGACLADDMGLGKTLQTIALMLYAKSQVKDEGWGNLFSQNSLKALLIMPASLVFNWQRELSKFAPSLFTYAHVGPKRLKDIRAIAAHDVVLTTYHTARQDLNLLEKQEWQLIVLDESQHIKNQHSELSKVVRHLRTVHKISLSGTPIENSLSDLWTQMEFINPGTLGAYRQFREQFQVPIEKQRDERAREKLFTRVRPFFLRRTKEEVAPDLPEKTEQIFYIEMSDAQRRQYDQLKSAMRNQILSLFDDPKTRLQALQALTKLRQIANHPRLADHDYSGDSGKTDEVMAQWDIIRRSGHKVLFFSTFEKHLQVFKEIFDLEQTPYAWLTGETPSEKRAAEVARFQENSDVQAFFMTLKAGGVGLNLTAADYVFILDPWWNPAAEDQAIARAHRIGQTRPVTALRFIARDTLEEKIILLQERKRTLGQSLFATDQEFPTLNREDIEMLLG